MSAQSRGWGHPDDRGYFATNIRKLQVAGVTLWVHKAVLPLFRAFIEELVDGGYRLDGTADDWGYANRDIRGRPGVKSNHSWGLAVDLNATTNPMTNDGRVHTDLPPSVGRMASKYGLHWGGWYSGRKDPMHFEFTGTPAEASRLVARLSSSPARGAQTPAEEWDVKYKSVVLRSEDKSKDGSIALVAPGYFRHVDGEAWKIVKDNGFVINPDKPEDVNQREWDVLKAINSK